MSIYDLPASVVIGGEEFEIDSDYRTILDIIMAMNDPDLSDEERAFVTLCIFYPDAYSLPKEHMEDAVAEMISFINCGESSDGKDGPKLVDWEQDFKMIISAINKVAGREVRAMDYLHWWTFLSYYNEIDGECLFSQVVGIRSKLARGKKLDDQDKEFYKRNRKIIDFKNKYSEEDEEIFERWI